MNIYIVYMIYNKKKNGTFTSHFRSKKMALSDIIRIILLNINKKNGQKRNNIHIIN